MAIGKIASSLLHTMKKKKKVPERGKPVITKKESQAGAKGLVVDTSKPMKSALPPKKKIADVQKQRSEPKSKRDNRALGLAGQTKEQAAVTTLWGEGRKGTTSETTINKYKRLTQELGREPNWQEYNSSAGAEYVSPSYDHWSVMIEKARNEMKQTATTGEPGQEMSMAPSLQDRGEDEQGEWIINEQGEKEYLHSGTGSPITPEDVHTVASLGTGAGLSFGGKLAGKGAIEAGGMLGKTVAKKGFKPTTLSQLLKGPGNRGNAAITALKKIGGKPAAQTGAKYYKGNLKAKNLITKILRKNGMGMALAGVIGTMAFTYGWSADTRKDAVKGYDFMFVDLREANTDEADAIAEELKLEVAELLDRSTWERITEFIPGINVYLASKDEVKKSITKSRVEDFLREDQKAVRDGGNDMVSQWKQRDQEKAELDKEVNEHYLSIQKELMGLKAQATKDKNTEMIKIWTDQIDRSQKAKEDEMKMIANFWTEYSKKKTEATGRSNLNFGLL